MDKKRLVWICGVTCNGNTHSFLSLDSGMLGQFFSLVEIVYHPTLTIDTTIDDILNDKSKIDFLVLEGAIPLSKWNFEGHPFLKIFEKLLLKTEKLITLGTCATYGGVHAQANDHVVGWDRYKKLLKPLVLSKIEHLALPGCPAHPSWFVSSVLLSCTQNVECDEENRPLFLFGTTPHEGCTRGEYFEWKIDGNIWGEKGCLFYSHGCQGPMTKAPCNEILWNGVSSKTRAGMPCIGCTEKEFPRMGLFTTQKHMGLPARLPLGVSKKAYFSLAGVAKTFTHGRLG